MTPMASSSTTERRGSTRKTVPPEWPPLHLVGDQNFGTSLRSVLSDRLTGYNPITGTALGSHDVHLTLDASLNETAYAALNGHKGVVAVYDYTTGDIKCLVSSPSYDPNNPPSDVNENSAYEGVYLNRFFSSTYPPRLGV